MNLSSHTAIPVFLCTPQLKSPLKTQRLNRLPKLLHGFVEDRCQAARIPFVPGEDPDPVGECIIGAAIIRFSAVWGPMQEMDDEKRSMWAIIFSTRGGLK
jgi:hypothetical protein